MRGTPAVQQLALYKLELVVHGAAYTFTTIVADPQPVVYRMVVFPAATPVTTPPDVIVAFAVLLLDHVPLPVASAKLIVLPTPTDEYPVIGPGIGLIVTVAVTDVTLQPLADVAVKEYTPALAADAPDAPDTSVTNDVGLVIAVPPLGPAHEYVLAPVAVPVSVKLPPTHTVAGDAVAVTPVGAVFTVSGVVVTTDVVPHAGTVAVNVYVAPLSLVETEVTPALPLILVAFEILVTPPVHKYAALLAPTEVAVNTIGVPEHTVVGFTVAVREEGKAFTESTVVTTE